MENWELLNKWVAQTMADNVEMLRKVKSSTEFYANLYEIWVADVQKSVKKVSNDVLTMKGK